MYSQETLIKARMQQGATAAQTAAGARPKEDSAAQTAAARPQDAYRRQDILTASPTDLIVMLYEALKKNIILGRRDIQKSNNQNAHNHLMKAQAIVTELINCLDMNYPISEELLLIYDFISRSLKEANIRKEPDSLEPLPEIIDDLKEAWQEVSQKNRGSVYKSETQE